MVDFQTNDAGPQTSDPGSPFPQPLLPANRPSFDGPPEPNEMSETEFVSTQRDEDACAENDSNCGHGFVWDWEENELAAIISRLDQLLRPS